MVPSATEAKGLLAHLRPRYTPSDLTARAIDINNGTPDKSFKGNYVSTTKYNIVTYFPKALFEQYR